MASFNKTSSPYTTTPIKDYYMDLWVNITIPSSTNDELFTITSKYDERPDLLAYDKFGSSRLWWVFARVNMDILIDPIGDFKSGLQITIPSLKNMGQLI